MSTATVNPTNDPVHHIPGASVPASPPPQPVSPEMRPSQDAMQSLFEAQHVRAEALSIRQSEKFQLMVDKANKFGLKEWLILLGVVTTTAGVTVGIQKLIGRGGEEIAS